LEYEKEMALRNKVFTGLLLLGLVEILNTRAFPQTRVALHATQAEVAIWKQRAAGGPYKEGWDIIKKRADSFLYNPEPRWAGKTQNGCYNQKLDGSPNRIQDRGLRDAGFVYLVTGDTAYRNRVLSALLAQAEMPGTDFSNSAKWCALGSGAFEVANWVRRLVYGYSYIRYSLSAAEQRILDKWFLNSGIFFEGANHAVIKTRFPNRLNDDYSSCASARLCPGSSNGLLHFGGPMTYSFSRSWANQPATITAVFAAIGVTINNATLKDRAKRFVHEWLKFAVWPNGAVRDQDRWGNGQTPQVGYTYAGTTIGSIVTIVEHLARDGDTSLYEFSTADGMFGTQGGSKSVLSVLQHYAGLTNGSIREYASTTLTSNPKFLIDHTAELGGKNVIAYINMAPANLYYKDPSIKKAYQTPIPRSYASGGYDPRGGDWGSYPDILFMFGGLENVVWPYPTGLPTMLPPAESSDVVVNP